MARARRSDVFDEDTIGIYHCTNRCVRRAHLCGFDRLTKRSFDHRRRWVRELLIELAAIFAIDHLNFAILGNHLHVLLRNRPDVRDRWTDEEVARRWWRLFPKRRNKSGQPDELTEEDLQSLLSDPDEIWKWRRRLGHISWFMRCLAYDIAVRANREDQPPGERQALGRFWQGRFKAQRILDEAALLACSLYIDLNPIRARLAETPETSWFTSVFERIHSSGRSAKETLAAPADDQQASSQTASCRGAAAAYECSDEWLSPVEVTAELEAATAPPSKRASNRGYLPLSFARYLELLDWTGRQIHQGKKGAIPSHLAPVLERLGIARENWVDLVTHFGRWFGTAVGRAQQLAEEAKRRGKKYLRGQGRCETVFSP